jgi:hypothetical protein
MDTCVQADREALVSTGSSEYILHSSAQRIRDNAVPSPQLLQALTCLLAKAAGPMSGAAATAAVLAMLVRSCMLGVFAAAAAATTTTQQQQQQQHSSCAAITQLGRQSILKSWVTEGTRAGQDKGFSSRRVSYVSHRPKIGQVGLFHTSGW